ncbi:MAG TPA: hypothetical protein VLV31_01875 [Candidatus Acidoferrales bacterium]|nr:hypothetical protein [Candidatus Acidoferrales bacterium]
MSRPDSGKLREVTRGLAGDMVCCSVEFPALEGGALVGLGWTVAAITSRFPQLWQYGKDARFIAPQIPHEVSRSLHLPQKFCPNEADVPHRGQMPTLFRDIRISPQRYAAHIQPM